MEGLRAAQDSLTRLLLGELEAAGIDLVGEGSFRWDSIYDVTRRIEGCSGFDQLTRIPGTNQFHRQPVADLPLSRERPLLVDDLSFAKASTSKPLVVSLPGPYSTARQTQNVGEMGLGNLTFAYADVFNQEAVDLIRNGAAIVRIEEPQILDHPEDMEIFKEAMGRLAEGVDLSRLALATWFGGIEDPDFFQLPFGIFALDFVRGKETVSILPNFPSDKKLIAGIIDARHPYQESDRDLAKLVGSITKHVSPSQVLLSPNTDMHFLPWDDAIGKVRKLAEFATNYRSGTVRPDTLESAPIRVISSVVDLGDLSSMPKISEIAPSRIAFPTSTVGSFPQPQELRTARVVLRNRKLGEDAYLNLVREYTKQWMEYQNQLGITVPVSGEFSRDDMAAFFGRKWGGEDGDFVPSYENRRYHPIVYRHELYAGKAFTVEDFQFLQSISDRPVKSTLTGPATMADWALLEHGGYYRDQSGFRRELAQAVRAEIKALTEAGATIVQVDEPALTTNMRRLSGDLQAIYDSVIGFDATYLILHLCYSDMGTLDKALPDILQLPFQQVHLETANRGYKLLELVEEHGFGGKDIGLGVTDVHSDRIETVAEIMAGVRKARQYFQPEQIWLTPDCGLKERSEEVALAKLKVMSEAASISRVALI